MKACNHKWARTGLFVDGSLRVPCLRGDCEAELQAWGSNRVINTTGFSQVVNGIELDITDDPVGGVAKIVMREIRECYDFDSVPFSNGDVVVDVGAHVGVVSIYLAKKYPGITVYAVEPVPQNFRRLVDNIRANEVPNVVPLPFAVTGDGRRVAVGHALDVNSGAGSIFMGGEHGVVVVDSVTLEGLFEWFDIETCKLLKISCMGCEHEVLNAAGSLLRQIEYLRGEVHTNEVLEKHGYTPERLEETLMKYFEPSNVKLNVSEM